MTCVSDELIFIAHIVTVFGWLVVCIEDLRRFSGISAISRLGSSRYPISEIQVARRGIEPLTSCSADQELNHSATASPLLFLLQQKVHHDTNTLYREILSRFTFAIFRSL